MNRVRGESMLLKAKIEGDMPCLSAELIKRTPRDSPVVTPDGGPPLEGQISSWTIRLRNVGTAPASAVTLKTNLPWIKVVEEEENLSNEEKEIKATSCCIGPSGTMMLLPVGKEPGTIEPGQIVDIPIQVRTSGNKKQCFYMLYRYELYDPGAQSKPRHRWLRKMYEVPVYPSLFLTAKTLTASWKGKDLLLSVELTNNRTDRPTDLFVTLDHLGLASRHYRLEALPGQFTTDPAFGDVLQIGWQERITLHYRVIQVESDYAASCLLSECAFSESVTSTTKPCVVSDTMGYLCLEQAYESFQVRGERCNMNAA
mmetsp:Transcript_1824/g.3265  ORF Transcript_1824/g.3265 Transcript_1824/m.3265 type:complete len:313 (-) Transcript_1824:2304-3242(-)